MAARSDKTAGVKEIELLSVPDLPMDADAILKDFTHYFGRMLGRRTIQTSGKPFSGVPEGMGIWVRKALSTALCLRPRTDLWAPVMPDVRLHLQPQEWDAASFLWP